MENELWTVCYVSSQERHFQTQMVYLIWAIKDCQHIRIYKALMKTSVRGVSRMSDLPSSIFFLFGKCSTVKLFQISSQTTNTI